MTFLDELEKCERGRIAVAQIARAIAQANTPDLEDKLKRFLQRCAQLADERLVRGEGGLLDVRASLAHPIIYDEPQVWFFADKADVDRGHKLATLVEASTFRHLAGMDDTAGSELSPAVVASATPAVFDGAKLGPRPQAPKCNIFWATRYENLRAIAPDVDVEGPLPLPAAQGKALRDYLGLAQARERQAVLLVLERQAAQAHDGEVRRPFLFDGIDNACFHQFDRHACPGGWNHALNLSHLANRADPAEGGPEVVLSSMPASRIARCVLVESPPSGAMRHAEVLDFMLGGADYAAARDAIQDFMSW